MNNGPSTYDLGAIRELLVAVFQPQTLRRFCQVRPDFQPLLADFGPKYNLNDMIDEVIAYCQAHDLWDKFLAGVREEYPRRYARAEPHLRATAAARPAAAPTSGAARLLRDRRLWLAIAAVVVLILVTVALVLVLRPEPTAYMALVLDNGPIPIEREFEELKAMVQEEADHALPDAALSLRVFGAECGQTRQAVDFARGNAGAVAEALAEVQPVGGADLAEAVRQSLNDLLALPGDQPRVLVAITWGKDTCGGDLAKAMAAYQRQLGSAVYVELLSLGGSPASISSPGVEIQQGMTIEQVRVELARINDALASGSYFTPSPTDTPPTPTPDPNRDTGP